MFSHPEWQNQNFWLYSDRSDPLGDTVNPPKNGQSRVPIAPADWSRSAAWRSDLNGEITAYDAYNYTRLIDPLLGAYATDPSFVFLNQTKTFATRAGARYFVSNLLDQLNDAGEWYLDKSKKQIYFLPPGGDPSASPVVVSRLNELLIVAGTRTAPVSHVTIRGLTFEHTAAKFSDGDPVHDDGALWVTEASQIRIENSRFRDLSGTGVLIAANAVDVTVTHNVFSGIGNSAVLVHGHKAYGPRPQGPTIDGNFVQRASLLKLSPAIFIYGADNAHVTNNTVDRSGDMGISVASQSTDIYSLNTLVSGNEVTWSVLNSADHGGIYVAGNSDDDTPVVMKTTIEYNRVLHSIGASSDTDGILLAPNGASGIYLDNFASGNLVRTNVVSDSSHANLKLNGASQNRLEQNVLGSFENAVRDRNEQMEVSSHFIAPGKSNFLTDNTFYLNFALFTGTDATLPFLVFGDFPGPDQSFSSFDGNLYWRKVSPDLSRAPNFFENSGAGQSFTAWNQLGKDTNAGVASENPGAALASDGRTVLGNAVGGWTSAKNYGPSAQLLTGLRRAFSGSNAVSVCINALVGPQLDPVDRVDPEAVYRCLNSR